MKCQQLGRLQFEFYRQSLHRIIWQLNSNIQILDVRLLKPQQEVYGKLEEPDGLSGLVQLRRGGATPADHMLAAQKAGAWSEALSLYEQVPGRLRKLLLNQHLQPFWWGYMYFAAARCMVALAVHCVLPAFVLLTLVLLLYRICSTTACRRPGWMAAAGCPPGSGATCGACCTWATSTASWHTSTDGPLRRQVLPSSPPCVLLS